MTPSPSSGGVGSATSPNVLPTANIHQVLDRNSLVIDLRSPAEFELDHLPGALSMALFDDAERVIVGTLYKRQSPEAAFDEARELARDRIRSLVGEIAKACRWSLTDSDFEARLIEMTSAGVESLSGELLGQPVEELPDDAVVFHCWRGGLRSRSVVAFLRSLGFDRAVVLEDGYKAYRREVVRELESASFPPAIVLRGLTGVGKTLVLRELERIRPGWTVDLELLAGHRSSILGMVGLDPCSQKAFDSRIAAQLRAGLSSRVVYEGESRKVGDAIVPTSVWSSLSSGANVRLTAPISYRVDVLIEDYLATPESRQELRERLPFIEQRLGATKWKGELVRRLDGGQERELVEILLERYYDPLYSHSGKETRYSHSMDSTDPVRAAVELAEWIENDFVPH